MLHRRLQLGLGSDAVRCAENRGAVQRYFEALDKGFLGQTIRERYHFDGQVGLGGIVKDTDMSVDQLIISDLQELLNNNDDRLERTKSLLTYGAAEVDNPGIELVRTMVAMMNADTGTDRRKRALRGRLVEFMDENELDVGKVDRLLDILIEG